MHVGAGHRLQADALEAIDNPRARGDASRRSGGAALELRIRKRRHCRHQPLAVDAQAGGLRLAGGARLPLLLDAARLEAPRDLEPDQCGGDNAEAGDPSSFHRCV